MAGDGWTVEFGGWRRCRWLWARRRGEGTGTGRWPGMWGRASVAVEVEWGFWLVLAMMVLLIPLPVLVGLMTAAAVHELGHILAIRLTGGRIRQLVLGPRGACLRTDAMPPGRELICALAGPAAGALTITLWPRFPELALAALVQTAFNLLPLYPLDGGRAFRAARRLRDRPGTSNRTCADHQNRR